MDMKMGFGWEIVVGLDDEIKKGKTSTVKFKLDDAEETTLFTAYKDSGDKITYTDKVEKYEGLKLTHGAAGETETYGAIFRLKYQFNDSKHMTAKEHKFYTTKHTFTVKVDDTKQTWSDLYIQPSEITKEMYFAKIEDAGNDYAYVTIKDFQYNMGDVGDTGKGSFGEWEITSKKETDNDGYTFQIKVPTPSTSTTYTLEMNLSDCKRANEYWRAVGPYKNYSVYLYDLFLPKMYIKAEGNIYRLVTVKREEDDRVIYIAVAGTPLSTMNRYYIKYNGVISEIETKNDAT